MFNLLQKSVFGLISENDVNMSGNSKNKPCRAYRFSRFGRFEACTFSFWL